MNPDKIEKSQGFIFMKNFVLFLVLLLAAAIFFFKDVPTQRFPYTYTIKKQNYPELLLAEQADVLLVGDRQALYLGEFIPMLQDLFFQTFSQKVKIYNWASPKEGIHRTLDKIKSLKKFPVAIIYLGGSEEFLEKLFNVKHYKRIQKNFEQYADINVLSWIERFPITSRYFFYLPQYIHLGQFEESLEILGAKEELQKNEINLKLFELALRELSAITLNNKSELLILTTPVNLLQEPSVCKAATNDKFRNELYKVEVLLQNGKIKEALSILELFKNSTLANAKVWYLYGKTFLELGRSDVALQALRYANALDCSAIKDSVLVNSIKRRVAREYSIRLIDFNEMVNKDLGAKDLFTPSNLPEDQYWKTLVKDLEEKIAPLL